MIPSPALGEGEEHIAELLVVEDDEELGRAIAQSLREDYYQVVLVGTAEQAIDEVRGRRLDLVLLDVVLPGMSGFEACPVLRSDAPNVPVLMITALDSLDDTLRGLEFGADDYLVKPFGLAEMKARVHALLRRRSVAPRSSPLVEPVAEPREGLLRVDPVARCAWYGEMALGLRPREVALLESFLRRPGLVLTRDTIRSALAGPSEMGAEPARLSDNSLDRHVHDLRRKLAAQVPSVRIETIHRLGWRIDLDAEVRAEESSDEEG